MNQDDATYTVTISGPGFSVMAERSDGGLAGALTEAVVMLSGRSWRISGMLAEIVQSMDGVGHMGDAVGLIKAPEQAFINAAYALVEACRRNTIASPTPRR